MTTMAVKNEEEALLLAIERVASARDKDAFTRLFDHYVPLIKAFTLSAYPGANLLAAEIAQDVMLKIWRKAHTFKPEAASLNTWVYTLARNSRIDYFRKNGKHQSSIDPESVYADLCDDAPGPFELAQQHKEKSHLHTTLKALPKEQQAVLIKVYIDGKNHREAAKELGLPLGTVKSRIRLALQKLTHAYRQRA